MADANEILRMTDYLAHSKLHEYMNFKTIKTQEDALELLRLKAQYDALDGLNIILQAVKNDSFRLDKIIEDIKKANYQTDDSKIDAQLKRLGFE